MKRVKLQERQHTVLLSDAELALLRRSIGTIIDNEGGYRQCADERNIYTTLCDLEEYSTI